MVGLRKKVYGLGAPKSTNEVGIGSISRKQQIGAKRGATINISQEPMAAPQTLPNPTTKDYREVQLGMEVVANIRHSECSIFA